MSKPETSLVLYLPVFHRGYINLFRKYGKRVRTLWILGTSVLKELRAVEEIRALDPSVACTLVAALGVFSRVEVLVVNRLGLLRSQQLVLVRDQLSVAFAQRYLASCRIAWDSAFLRWDEKRVFSRRPAGYDRVSRDRFDREMMALARAEGEHTSDWWRQVGAVLVRDRKVLQKAHNAHVPSEHAPYILGDPRDFIRAGIRSDVSSALHAEKGIIATAARSGMKLLGTHLYITVFPCPDCAKLIAYSGITKCFFTSGHASLDGQDVLRANHVELVLVR